MKRIALLSHPTDNRIAKALAAALRQLLNPEQYQLWQKEDLNAFGDAPSQFEGAIAEAWAVLVLVGPQGVDDEFANLAQGAIQQRIADDGTRFGRLRVSLPDSVEPPAALKRWVEVEGQDAKEIRVTAEAILARLSLKPHWSRGLTMEAAAACIPEGEGRQDMLDHFTDVAHTLADGKPLTLMIGPYGSVEDNDDGSCPSQVRKRLIDFIKDASLREMLMPLEAAANAGAIPPLLWQDHLATLCILSGRSREEVADCIDRAIGTMGGDTRGKPHGLFMSIGTFASKFESINPPRCAGLPALTILTVCPGLRPERALIANNCAFERATLMFGQNTKPELHRMMYRPTPRLVDRAANGDEHFMPDFEPPASANDVAFVRLVKLFGSRDLDSGVPSGDFGQTYDLMGQLRLLLEDFVTGAKTGPYVVLGGGLGTPPVQAAHAILLRNVLAQPQRRPRLAIVPKRSASPDPLRQAETGRLASLVAVPNSGFERLKIVLGDPVCFMNALIVAFGGQIPAKAA